MKTIDELKNIFNTVQKKVLNECWNDLDSMSELALNTKGNLEQSMQKLQSKVNNYLDEYNLTTKEKETIRMHSFMWGLESPDIKSIIVKNKLDKK